MNSFVALLAVVAVVAADVSHLVRSPEADAQIKSQDTDVSHDGYNFGFETSNGISRQESGALKASAEGEAIAVQGASRYTAPDGTPIELIFEADENGFQARGAHLPTPPPPQEIPDYILRSIEYNLAHAPREELARKQ